MHNLVKWSSKAARHIELRENLVREWIQSKLLSVKHVSGKLNPSDIFTKEMRDGTHFRRLRDSFISHLSDFVNASLLTVHHARRSAPSPIPAAAHAVLAAGPRSYFSALASSSFCRSLPAISHLSSAGRQLLESSWFCSVGFHIALASIGVFGFSFFAGFWFLAKCVFACIDAYSYAST